MSLFNPLHPEITIRYGFRGVLPKVLTINEEEWTRTNFTHLSFKKALKEAIALKDNGFTVRMIVTDLNDGMFIGVYFKTLMVDLRG